MQVNQRVPIVPILQIFVLSIGLGPLGERTRNALIETDEVPEEGWALTSQLSYRTLVRDNVFPKHKNARRTRSVTGRRRFANRTKDRQFEIVVIPYSSAEEANLAIQRWRSLYYRAPFRNVELANQRIVDPSRSPEFLDALLAEADLRIGNRVHSFKFVGRSVGKLMVAMYFWAPDGNWSWNEVAAIANMQTTKARSVNDGAP